MDLNFEQRQSAHKYWWWSLQTPHVEITVKLISKLAKLVYDEYAVLRVQNKRKFVRDFGWLLFEQPSQRGLNRKPEKFCIFTMTVILWLAMASGNDFNTDEILNRPGDLIFNELNRIWIQGTQFKLFKCIWCYASLFLGS